MLKTVLKVGAAVLTVASIVAIFGGYHVYIDDKKADQTAVDNGFQLASEALEQTYVNIVDYELEQKRQQRRYLLKKKQAGNTTYEDEEILIELNDDIESLKERKAKYR